MTFRTFDEMQVTHGWPKIESQITPNDPIYDPFLTMQWPRDESIELWITPIKWPLYNFERVTPDEFCWFMMTPWMIPGWPLDDP